MQIPSRANNLIQDIQKEKQERLIFLKLSNFYHKISIKSAWVIRSSIGTCCVVESAEVRQNDVELTQCSQRQHVVGKMAQAGQQVVLCWCLCGNHQTWGQRLSCAGSRDRPCCVTRQNRTNHLPLYAHPPTPTYSSAHARDPFSRPSSRLISPSSTLNAPGYLPNASARTPPTHMKTLRGLVG